VSYIPSSTKDVATAVIKQPLWLRLGQAALALKQRGEELSRISMVEINI
jgi:hypothetical protein